MPTFNFNPVKTVVDGTDVLMVSLAEICSAADASSRSIARTMMHLLEEGMWPEPLIRNHPTLSTEEQIRLLQSRVVVIGLGGLGGHLSTLLSRVGIGHLVLVDGDRFEGSNLNRQVLCATDTIGESKAEVAARQCSIINPALETTVWNTDFSEANGGEILASADLVMDGLDQIPTRKALFSMAMSMKTPFVHGAVHGWYGQTATFLPESSLTLEAIYPGEPPQSSPPSVLAPVVATVASLQTQEAIRILSGRAPANAGVLAYFDGHEMSLHRLKLA